MSEALHDLRRPPVSESVVSDQNGVLATWQATSLFGRHRIAREVRAGRWHRPARGVVVLHNGPPSRAQQQWAALFACARGSVLGGITALRCDGFTGLQSEGELPRVVQPMGARVPSYDGVEVHWSEYMDGRDVHPLRRPARHRPARAAVDEASWTPRTREKRARAIILSVAQQRMAAPRLFRETLERRGACRHRALIVESVLDAAGGIQSLPERDFDRIRIEFGLPEPTRQAKVKRDDGRYYLDVEWRAYDTACEINGIPICALRSGRPTSSASTRSRSTGPEFWCSARTRFGVCAIASPISSSGCCAEVVGVAEGADEKICI